ncbi:hypothetical protein [[Clostridium] scindens]|uniref:hypothetical protein n=1 Tax=Clostridium scindens (strain JCM 10418 / VPI 12708) TaxID=29347 RepID=UPI001E2E7742|nr:hypothetical protein [[Clostridium] scindens]BCZ31630.1 hypothetical protein CSCING10_028240 [[Clostridium] scindens]
MYNMQLNTGYAGKPHVTAENCADLNRGIVGSDSYVLPVGAQFEVELVTNNLLKIKDGCGCMQGRQVSIAKGQTDEITIENGTQGEKRIDLVVIRYSKNADTGIETAIPFLVKGIPSENNPVRPEHLEGDIRGGDLTADWPLYELYLDGISVTNVKPLFDVLMSVDSLNRNFANVLGILTNIKGIYVGSKIAACNQAYALLHDTASLTKILGKAPTASNFICMVMNGDANAAQTSYYSPRYYSGDGLYVYVYPNVTGSIRINYVIFAIE